MKKLAAILAGAALMLATTSAMAAEQTMQQILNSITQGGVSHVNAATDFIKDPNDAYWRTGGVGISSATMIIELAGLQDTNTFGIYDSSNVTKRAELFGGTAAAGHKVAITFGHYGSNNLLVQDLIDPTNFTYYNFNSKTFGFYFDDNKNNHIFYSDTAKNDDKVDHMVAYGKPKADDQVMLPGADEYTPWLPNEYVLGFEDTYGGGDRDYNDMVLMVESVAPVPEPGTMVLLGAGFLGLAIYGKRRKNA